MNYGMTSLGAGEPIEKQAFIPDNLFTRSANAAPINTGTASTPLESNNPPVNLNKQVATSLPFGFSKEYYIGLAAVVLGGFLLMRKK